MAVLWLAAWLIFSMVCFFSVAIRVVRRKHRLDTRFMMLIGFVSIWAGLMGPVGVWLVHFMFKKDQLINGR